MLHVGIDHCSRLRNRHGRQLARHRQHLRGGFRPFFRQVVSQPQESALRPHVLHLHGAVRPSGRALLAPLPALLPPDMVRYTPTCTCNAVTVTIGLCRFSLRMIPLLHFSRLTNFPFVVLYCPFTLSSLLSALGPLLSPIYSTAGWLSDHDTCPMCKLCVVTTARTSTSP